MSGVDCFVPTAADSEVLSSGFEMYRSGVSRRNLSKNISRAIRRVIVDNDQVELEACSLRKRAGNRVVNGALAIADRYYDACPDWKAHVGSGNVSKLGFEISADPFEMFAGDLFHLILILAAARINVVKLSLTGSSTIHRDASVERLRNS